MSVEPEESPRESPAVTDNPDPVVDAEGLVAQMVEAGEWPSVDLLKQILAQGEAAVPHLLAVMKTRPRGWPGEAPLLNAAGLLSMIRPLSALPVLRDGVRDYLGDTTQLLAQSMVAFGPEAVDPILSLIHDPAVTGFQRAHLYEAAREAAGDDPASRARIATVLRDLFARESTESEADSAFQEELLEASARALESPLDTDLHEMPISTEIPDFDDDDGPEDDFDEELADEYEDEDEVEVEDQEVEDQDLEDGEIDEEIEDNDDDAKFNILSRAEDLAFLASSLASLSDPASVDLVHEAFNRKVIDESIIDRRSFERTHRSGGKATDLGQDWLEVYQKQLEEFRQSERRWAESRMIEYPTRTSYPAPEDLQAPPQAPEPPLEPFRKTGPAIGRNDPCWCGSGKKYKKCHLGKDAPT